MNRETRTFVWGLILFLIGGAAMFAAMHDYSANGLGLNVLYFVLSVALQVIGLIKIIKTTD